LARYLLWGIDISTYTQRVYGNPGGPGFIWWLQLSKR